MLASRLFSTEAARRSALSDSQRGSERFLSVRGARRFTLDQHFTAHPVHFHLVRARAEYASPRIAAGRRRLRS
jgi:hypothetical protein